jgi:hypothetical protein
MRKRSQAGAVSAGVEVVDDFGDLPVNGARVHPPEASPPPLSSPPVTPLVYESAHRDVEEPLDPRFEKLVETAFVDDPFAVYEELEAALTIGEKRNDRGTVQERLDTAATNSRRAFKLWRTAQLVAKDWELRNRPVFASRRAQALAALEAEKQAGERKKAIAEADVLDMVATMFPKEHHESEVRRLKIHPLERNAENLFETWREECRLIAVIAGLLR